MVNSRGNGGLARCPVAMAVVREATRPFGMIVWNFLIRTEGWGVVEIDPWPEADAPGRPWRPSAPSACC
jgi:hypothetical protein